MQINSCTSYNPSFTASKNMVVDIVADPTDVRNRDAAGAGVITASGVGGAAIVANKLRTMARAAKTGNTFVQNAAEVAGAHKNALKRFGSNLIELAQKSKITAWMGNLAKNPAVRKTFAAFGGILAVGITATQIYSAGDMAVEAVKDAKAESV